MNNIIYKATWNWCATTDGEDYEFAEVGKQIGSCVCRNTSPVKSIQKGGPNNEWLCITLEDGEMVIVQSNINMLCHKQEI